MLQSHRRDYRNAWGAVQERNRRRVRSSMRLRITHGAVPTTGPPPMVGVVDSEGAAQGRDIAGRELYSAMVRSDES
jgi:hypothetical protein